MPATERTQSQIIRNSRGLTIDGLRVTILDVMDGLRSEWPPDEIGRSLRLSDAQLQAALDFIESNREECEREYAAAEKRIEENQRYWAERNKDRLAEIASRPTTPEQAIVRKKIAEWRQQRGSN